MEKLPPHSNEFESWVIGGILQSGEARVHAGGKLSEVDWEVLASTGLTPNDFFNDQARACAHAIFTRLGDNQQPSLPQLLTDCPDQSDYIRNSYRNTPSPALVVPSARAVHRMAVSRQLIQAASAIARLGYEDNLDPAEATAKAELILACVDAPPATKPQDPAMEISTSLRGIVRGE